MVINIHGLEVRSLRAGSVYPKNGGWHYTIVVNGFSWESPDGYEDRFAAERDQTADVTRLREFYQLEPAFA